jgi:Glycine zipper 2TM domain
VVGHQFDSDKGKVIGAILGAAAGTAAARRTGQEVVVPAGTVLGFTIDSPVTVTM